MAVVSIVTRGLRRLYRTINERFDFLVQLPKQELKPPDFAFEPQPNLIVDLGMNDGSDTLFYLKKGFDVVAVEANPALVETASRRFARFIEANSLRILNCGISDKDSDPLDFYVNHTRSEWSSFIKDIGARGPRGHSVQRVPMMTIADLFAKFGTPYYLKIDIEGYDQRIIDALKPLPHRPRYVSAEEGGAIMIDALHSLGATGFKIVDQTAHQSNGLPRKQIEGLTARHYFVGGSSGPFGEETAGGWTPYEEFRRTYIGSYRSEDGIALHSPLCWYDIHAKFC